MKSQRNFFNLAVRGNIIPIDLDRLAQAVIIQGEDMYSAMVASRQIAENLLSAGCRNNPDLFEIRPLGKGGLIKVEQLRDLISELQKSPYASKRKVAIIYEADRLGAASSNVLLKILEEPPMDSSIFLVTTKYSSLLPTVLSRCGLIRLPENHNIVTNQHLDLWLLEVSRWIKSLIARQSSLETAIIDCYLILDGLEEVLEAVAKDMIDASAFFMEDDALAVDDQRKSAQNRIFSALEIELSKIFYSNNNHKLLSIFIKIIESLESAAMAVGMNCNMPSALESVLLLGLKYLNRIEYDKCKIS